MPVAFDESQQAVQVQYQLEPAQNCITSMLLLHRERFGFNDWVRETARVLSEDQILDNKIAIEGFHYIVSPTESYPSFPDYMQYLKNRDPFELRNQLFRVYEKLRGKVHNCEDEYDDLAKEVELPDIDRILSSFDNYYRYLLDGFPTDYVHLEIEQGAYELLQDPPSMLKFIIGHMEMIWDRFLADEWRRTEPILQETVQAYQRMNFSALGLEEALKLLVDSEQQQEKMYNHFCKAKRIIFSPSLHVGSSHYKFFNADTFWVVLGARTPEGQHHVNPELTRSEMLVWLNALADDTRLQILRLLSPDRELSSNDIMEELELSQSAASRHLKQLSSTGLLTAKRVNSAKYYHLNIRRIEMTMAALKDYLLSV